MLEGKFTWCRDSPGVAIEQLVGGLGVAPSGSSVRDEANLCILGSGSRVHSTGIDGGTAEIEGIAVRGRLAKEEAMENGAPSTVGTDS